MLHHRRFGSGKTIVLQHGFVGCGEIFAPLSAHLAPNFDVIATDLPGLGGSADIPAPADVGELAKILVETLTELDVDRFSILGHSLGSETALHLAMDFPERVEKLILYGGCAGDLPERYESYEDSIRCIDADGIVPTAARIATTWTNEGANHPLYEFMRSCGVNSNQEGAKQLVRAMGNFDVRDRLGEVQAKTLIICGDMDRTTHPRHSIEMWEKIPNSQLCILPNSAHAAHAEVPGIFSQIVSRFLMED
jgi:2-hydroxy-6-oxonona-2,4-dienedioate hydrolase